MKEFKTLEAANRVARFVEKLGRKGWEPFYNDEKGFPKTTNAKLPFYDYNRNLIRPLFEVIKKSAGEFQALLGGNAHLLPNQGNPKKAPHGVDIATIDGWIDFEYNKIIDIIGSNSVTSVADATVKTTAYLQIVSQGVGSGKKRYLFRGQSNINHTLIPRLGRVMANEIKSSKINSPRNSQVVSDKELKDLEDFQKNWFLLKKDELDAFSASKYSADDAGWWVLMQHYADQFGNGTRMLDVTTSLLFALLFACVKWDTGEIDDSVDGIVYFFIEGHHSAVVDYLDKAPPVASDLFTTDHTLENMMFNPPHNERSKAQSGGFIWWPKFWEPLQSGLTYLRIPKENKLSIAKELLAFGVGPKEAVRGEKGKQNEKKLRSLIS